MGSFLPLILKDKYFEGVEKKINEFFDALFFDPIKEIIKKYVSDFYNQKTTALNQALWAGRVQFVKNKFYGKFDSQISAELKSIGAKFSVRTGTWNISVDKLPFEVISTATAASNNFKNMHKEIIEHLDRLKVGPVDLKTPGIETISMIEKDWKATARGVEVLPELSSDASNRLVDEYNNNLNLDIKKWSDENILKLRQMVDENSVYGARSSNLVKIIEQNFNVSRNKAKFLARQETSLFVARFKKNRYKDIGIVKYKWQTANDERTRADHKELNGGVFFYDQPPIVDKKTGRRANPGEDFGCRCRDLPIMD